MALQPPLTTWHSRTGAPLIAAAHFALSCRGPHLEPSWLKATASWSEALGPPPFAKCALPRECWLLGLIADLLRLRPLSLSGRRMRSGSHCLAAASLDPPS